MSTKTKTSDSGEIVAEVNIVKLALDDLRPFRKHAFKQKTKEELDRLRDSIKDQGVIQPIVVRFDSRPGNSGKYEIISGHSRVEAAKQVVELKDINAIIRELSDEEAIVLAIETNIAQRSFENWFHSERAKTIFQYHEINKNPGKRTDLDAKSTSGENHQKSDTTYSRRKTALAYGVSEYIVKMYLALNKLVDGLMERLDDKEFRPAAAYEFSLIKDEGQVLLDEVLGEYGPEERNVITVVLAKQIREILTACTTEELSGADKDSTKAKIRKLLTSDDEESELKDSKTPYAVIKLPIDQYNHFFSEKPKVEASKITIAALEQYFDSISEKTNEAV